MRTSFFAAAAKAWKLIQRDFLILVPSILVLMAIHLAMAIGAEYFQLTAHALSSKRLIGKLAGGQWILDLLMNGLTVLMVQQLQAGGRLDIRRLVKSLMRHFPRLVGITAPFGIAFWALVWWSVPASMSNLQNLPLPQILGLCTAGITSLILAILPPIILTQRPGLLGAYRNGLRLIFPHFFRVLLFGLMAFNIGLLVMLISIAVAEVPTVGDSVLSLVVQGAGFSYLYIVWTIFYQDLISEPQVLVIKASVEDLNPNHDPRGSDGRTG